MYLAFTTTHYSAAQVCGVVSLYWFVSIALVFINKWLLSSSDILLDAPLFITWSQCFITVVLCMTLSKASHLCPKTVSFTPLEFNWITSVRLMPLTIIFFTMIVCNNFCLKHLDVAFYFVARSLTTIFNVVLTYLILKKKTSWRALICCGVIIIGYLVSVKEEHAFGSLSIYGLIFGVSASLAVALFAIMTSKGLEHVQGSIWKLTFYNNFNSTCLFIIGIIVTGEISELKYIPFYPGLVTLMFWAMLLISGIFGFAISYVTTWQIQITSPLTHNISGTAKAAAQTLLAALIVLDFKSLFWWFGNLLVVIGSIAYAYVRHQFSRQEDSDQSQLPTYGDVNDGMAKPLLVDENEK